MCICEHVGMVDWCHASTELQGPDVGIMCNNGADGKVHLTVSVCTALANKVAVCVCMCMAAGDTHSCGHKISPSDMSWC